MRGVGPKTIGIAVLFVAFLLGSVNSIARTSFSILDTDSTTYIIIVMLMIFAFIAFYLKEDLKLSTSKKTIAIGAGLFVAYVVVLSYLRVSMSYAFATYRIDGIMFPLLLASLIVTLFGLGSLKRFNRLIVYSVFASPLLLMPFILANGVFANFNAGIVYGILKAAGINAVKSGITIGGASASTITIANTCVPLGIFIATVMLLLPLAYLYDGKLSRKALWVGSAVAAVLVLNIFRMSAIALVWANSGISGAVTLFHEFAGAFIFYIVIALFVLLAGRFGLSLRGARITKRSYAATRNAKLPLYPITFALLFGILAFILTMSYSSMLYASAANFSSSYNATANPQQLVGVELGALRANGFNVSNEGAMQSFEVYAARDAGNTSANSTIYIVSGYLDKPVPGVQMFRNTSVSNVTAELLPNGISLISAESTSNSTVFHLNYFSEPYLVNGSEVSVNYEMFATAGRGVGICGNGSVNRGPTITAAVDGFESAIYNFLSGHFGRTAPLCYAYEIASKAS